MNNLIKSLKTHKEELLVKSNGQWQLLSKAIWEKAPHISQNACICGGSMRNDKMHHYTCVDANSAPNKTQYNAKLNKMFADYHDALDAKSPRALQQHSGAIRDLVNNASPGSIDLGHLSYLQNKAADAFKASDMPHHGGLRFSHEDLRNAFDRHLDDSVKNLKDVHDHHGIEAVKGLSRAIGANTDPYHEGKHGPTVFHDHDNLALKPHLVGDVQALNLGAYGHHKTVSATSPGDILYYEYDNSNAKPKDDATTARHEALNDKVSSTYEDALSGDLRKLKAHEDAVVDRGVAHFKHHHGL